MNLDAVFEVATSDPLIAVQLIACAVSMIYAIAEIHNMGWHTREGVRWGYVLIVGGQFGELLQPFAGHVPMFTEVMLSIGIALFMVANGRRYHYPEHCPLAEKIPDGMRDNQRIKVTVEASQNDRKPQKAS